MLIGILHTNNTEQACFKGDVLFMIMTEQAMRHTIEVKDSFAKLCGFELVTVREGYAKTRMALQGHHKNAADVAHGGALYTLADIAFGAACNMGKTHVMLNVNANIAYMKMGKIGPITAEATKLNGSRKLETYQVHVFDGEGELIASGQFMGCRTSIPFEE